jgi:hypothetical protein
MVARQRLRVARVHARKTITVIVEDAPFRVLRDDKELRTRPRPSNKPVAHLRVRIRPARKCQRSPEHEQLGDVLSPHTSTNDCSQQAFQYYRRQQTDHLPQPLACTLIPLPAPNSPASGYQICNCQIARRASFPGTSDHSCHRHAV